MTDLSALVDEYRREIHNREGCLTQTRHWQREMRDRDQAERDVHRRRRHRMRRRSHAPRRPAARRHQESTSAIPGRHDAIGRTREDAFMEIEKREWVDRALDDLKRKIAMAKLQAKYQG